MSSASVKHGAVGRSVSRVDGVMKATGRATFAAEYRLPNLAHATLVPARIPRGRVVAIDDSGARRSAGVLGVMTRENAPEMRPAEVFGSTDTEPAADAS